MIPSILAQLAQTKMRDLHRGVHVVTHKTLTRIGFEYEIRSSGETKVGLWRLSLGKASAKVSQRSRLMMVPGFGDSSLSWAGVLALAIPALRKSKKYDELIIVDLPGFDGFLSHETAFPSMELLLQTMGDIFDSLKPKALLGHSLGAWIVSSYAADCGGGKRPAKQGSYNGPESLILMSPSGVFNEDSEHERFRDIFKDACEKDPELLRPYLFHQEPSWFKLLVPSLGPLLTREDIRQFIESFQTEHLVTPRVAQIRADTWLIWGDRDTLTLTEWRAGWEKGLSARSAPARSETLILENTGHMIHLEKTIEVAQLLSEILAHGATRGPRGLFPHLQALWRK